jgi:aspartate aminotransferase
MDHISDRLNRLSESQTLAMTRKSRELRAKGFDVINLSIGEPDFDTPQFIKEAAIGAINDNFTHYPPVPGYEDLLQAISTKFKRDNNLDYSLQQIVVSTGAKQSLANVVLSLVNPGDEVLLPAPFWVTYMEIVKLAEGKPIVIDSGIDQDFKVTAEEISSAITPKTKLIIFSSPCNPTGSVYNREELEKIAAVMANHPSVYIISDEIYEHILYNGDHFSIGSMDIVKDQVITINGVSKGFAMTGWRIGYIGAPKWIAKACNKIQGQVTSGASTISQKAAAAALNADPSVTYEMKGVFLKRRNLLLQLLNEINGLKTNVPQGAFYVFPKVSSFFGRSHENYHISNANDLCLYLLEKANVALVPGEAFGKPGYIRISYACAEKQLREAANRIKTALNNLA